VNQRSSRIAVPARPKLEVPRPQEVAELHPIVQLLLHSCQEHFVNVNAIDVAEVREQLRQAASGADVVFEDLFGEPYYLTATGIEHVISVHRGFARHVPARSAYFDIEHIGEQALNA
jgi:hypothetical protein